MVYVRNIDANLEGSCSFFNNGRSGHLRCNFYGVILFFLMVDVSNFNANFVSYIVDYIILLMVEVEI
jgi:hypothetical protein